METEEETSFITDELSQYLGHRCNTLWVVAKFLTQLQKIGRACNKWLTWGRGRWLCGSWPRRRCHSGPCRAWWHRWGLGEASRPHRRWTESEGNAAPCPGSPPAAGPGHNEGDQTTASKITKISKYTKKMKTLCIFDFCSKRACICTLLLLDQPTCIYSVFPATHLCVLNF